MHAYTRMREKKGQHDNAKSLNFKRLNFKID